MVAVVVPTRSPLTPPPDVIVAGNFTVLIVGQPAAHLGSNTAHGGVVMGTAATVLV